jgi:hypothetical protein
MSRRSHTLAAVVGSALLLAGVLTGCATPVTGSSASPAPTGTQSQDVDVDAAWLDGGSMIAVLLEGSSTCVPMADDVSYTDGVLHVSLLEPAADTACTRDLVLRGIPIALPEGVDASNDLDIEVSGEGYHGDTELDGVAGLVPGGGVESGLPSAGWADDDAFALLTWGSSSCVPTVENVVATTPGEIAVTFATPPADQVCTADFGPRVTVVTVPDLDDDATYEAVLTGDGFDGTRIAIAGTA